MMAVPATGRHPLWLFLVMFRVLSGPPCHSAAGAAREGAQPTHRRWHLKASDMPRLTNRHQAQAFVRGCPNE